MTELTYRSNAHVDDLALNECTMRACEDKDVRYWHLWFYVARESDGAPEHFCVPMNPGGSFLENGPGGKTWGLMRTAPGTWQVSPSINVLATKQIHPGPHEEASLWHQTPALIGVPDDEPWANGVAP